MALLWRSVFFLLQVLSAFGWDFLMASPVKTNMEIAKTRKGQSRGNPQNAHDGEGLGHH